MAIPLYDTDLVDITLAESVTGWSALGGGAPGLATGADFAMQGVLCVDKQVTAAEKGQVYNYGTTITLGANDHIFTWVFLATPGLATSLLTRGLCIVAGTSTTAYNSFHVEGSDTYGAVGRVGKCYPIRYLTTSNTTAPNYRTLTGTPGAAPQYFGATTNITGTVKSSNLGVDAIRYGTGLYITAGDVTYPASFVRIARYNDSNVSVTFTGNTTNTSPIITSVSSTTGLIVGQVVTGTGIPANAKIQSIDSGTQITLNANATATGTGVSLTATFGLNRFGILTAVGGVFELQGKLVIGQTKTFTPTAARFEASNAFITLVETPHSLTNFTQIIIDHASTVFNLTNCTIKSINLTNPGQLVYNNAATVSALSGCTFTNMGAHTLGAGVSATNTSWSGCGLITTNGATLTGCNIESSSSTQAITISSAAQALAISNTSFSTNNRAIQITAAGTYDFYGCPFSGNTYDIENSSSGAVIIRNFNGSNAATHINTGGGSTTFETTVNLSVTCVNEAGGTLSGIPVYIEKTSDKTILMNTTTNGSGVATASFNYPLSPVAINIRIRKASPGSTKYLPVKTTGTIDETGFSLTSTLFEDTIAAPS